MLAQCKAWGTRSGAESEPDLQVLPQGRTQALRGLPRPEAVLQGPVQAGLGLRTGHQAVSDDWPDAGGAGALHR